MPDYIFVQLKSSDARYNSIGIVVRYNKGISKITIHGSLHDWYKVIEEHPEYWFGLNIISIKEEDRMKEKLRYYQDCARSLQWVLSVFHRGPLA
jgi:hypothetical protein